jgi:uncharacterized RDD family membrane protein YckC
MSKIEEKETDEGYKLAPLLQRLTAAVLDLAFAVALGTILFYAFYRPVSASAGLYDKQNTLVSYRVSSGLMVEKDGVASDINSSNYEDYQKAVETYYLSWNVSGNQANPHPEGYTVNYYNTHILGLPMSTSLTNNSELFDWAKDAKGDPDSTQKGVFKDSLYSAGNLTAESKTKLLTFYQKAIDVCSSELSNENYYLSLSNEVKKTSLLLLSVVFFVPAVAIYAAMPLTNSSRQTLGKKIMKLEVLEVDGLPLPWWRALLRNSVLLITLLAALLLDDMVISSTIVLVVFLISISLGLLTPRRQALHDFLVVSVVALKQEDKHA